MSRRRSRWSDVLAPVGQAGLDLVRAEYGVVSSEIRTSSRVLARSLFLLVIGLFALFWAIGALALLLVEVGSLWLPRWGAALSVLSMFVAVGLVFAAIARSRLREIELPTQTVRRRIDEHRDWWEQRIAVVGPPRGRRSGEAPRENSPGDSDAASDRDSG
ncbi:MAG: phage holin family protein [Thermoanaerobaculia bacterium]